MNKQGKQERAVIVGQIDDVDMAYVYVEVLVVARLSVLAGVAFGGETWSDLAPIWSGQGCSHYRPTRSSKQNHLF